jgi:hypothetical protein
LSRLRQFRRPEQLENKFRTFRAGWWRCATQVRDALQKTTGFARIDNGARDADEGVSAKPVHIEYPSSPLQIKIVLQRRAQAKSGYNHCHFRTKKGIPGDY